MFINSLFKYGVKRNPAYKCGWLLVKSRCYGNNASKFDYFIATPIFYVNAVPHVGHLHSMVVADALHRFQILNGANKTIFSTGTDEHGLKVQRSAENCKTMPKEFCDQVSKSFQTLANSFSIGNTDFIRTSEERHAVVVRDVWNKIEESGNIKKSKYSGWYSLSDETFVPEGQTVEVIKDGVTERVSVESGNSVEWTEEENYVFKLSEFREKLLIWLESNNKLIEPEKFYNLAKHMLNSEIPDISISRPASRLHWGIKVPNDESQTIYVWLDALVNYLTVSGYPNQNNAWPIDCHVIGKDIIKFHVIYWPAFLMAAGLELPRKYIVHSHWTVDDLKMSKSRGNVVDPLEMANKYSHEAVRYYLLREGVPHMDGGFTELQLSRFANSELADNLGNLLGRCCANRVNKNQEIPSTAHSTYVNEPQVDNLKVLLNELPDVCYTHFSSANFNRGIEAIMRCLREANSIVNSEKPWQLAKDPMQQDRLNSCLSLILETCRICSILLQPIVPSASQTVLDKLSIDQNQRNWHNARQQFIDKQTRKLSTSETLVFKKIKAL